MAAEQGSRIVFGDDHSEGADVAWGWITAQRWGGWDLDVVTVDEPGPDDERPDDAELTAWTPAPARAPGRSAELGTIRHLRATGDPRQVLGDLDDARLVVVGSTGQGFLTRWLHLGSTAEHLVAAPPAPVVVAKSSVPVRRALVGIDGSAASERALRVLVSLPFAATLSVSLVGVYDGWAEPYDGVEAARAVLEPAGIEHRHQVIRGKASRVLYEEVRAQDPDLVVLGARGRSPLHHALAGSTARGLARAASTNVLVVPAG